MKQDDKFRLSPATTCPSFRVYYYGGGAGSVPFEWESEPGTPKHGLSNSHRPPPLPPLTPPPSHYTRKPPTNIKASASSKLLDLVVFPRFWSWSGYKVKNASAKSSSSSSMALIDHDYNMFKHRTMRRIFSSFDSGTSSTMDFAREDTTASTTCFGLRRCYVS